MDNQTERIRYLTRKAQRGAISNSERNELAKLLGKDPKKFQDSDGLDVLIGIALVALAAGLIASLIMAGKK